MNESSAMTDLLGNFSTFMTSFVITNITNLVTWITSTPLVMAVIAMFFTGFVVSIFFRIFKSA